MAVSLKIDDTMKARVQNLASARDRTAHWVMREAIREYVEREEKREAFRQAGLRAWESYQRTGLHVTGKDADAWLAKLEAGEDAELPTCRV